MVNGAIAEGADAAAAEGVARSPRQLTWTSALLSDPRSNEAEKRTSDDDGDCESDETEP
jgi:hypothetical protein